MASKLFILRPSMGQGGAERITLTLLRQLSRDQFEVSLVLMRWEGDYISDLPPDVSCYSLDASGLWIAWLPLFRLLRQHKPDVILSLGGMDIPAVIAHKISGQKGRLVLSERNTIFHSGLTFKRRLLIQLKKILYKQADQLTAVSLGVKADMVDKLGLCPDKIAVVYNPVVDDELYHLAQEPVHHHWFQENIPIVLGVGRLVPQKDFPTLIRAVARVRATRPVRLVILGEGPLKEELAALASSLEIADDVFFAGFDKNPFKYMSKSTLFVLSSIHEGLPGVLIQAMACGAPVIATDCPFGPSEIICAPGEDGILVDVGDAMALAEKIVLLLDSPEIRMQMGQKGRQSAGRFTVQAIMQNYDAVIRGIPY